MHFVILNRSAIAIDVFEPVRVAEAVKDMELEHVVITSVDRDDLIDGGADNLQILFMRLEKSLLIQL